MAVEHSLLVYWLEVENSLLDTGWRWTILYSGNVGVEHRSLETV